MPVTRSMSMDGQEDHDHGQVKMVQSISNAVSCSGSSCSNRSSSSKAKLNLLLSEQKAKQLKAEMELEAEKLRLDHKARSLAAENAIENAKLAVLMEDNEGLDELEDAVTMHGLERTNKYLTQRLHCVANPTTVMPISQDCQPVITSNPHNPVRTGTASSVHYLDLPKVELTEFDGRSESYWSFVRQFELYVEDRIIDEGQRLLYLMHYCKGKARAAISGCIMLPSDIAYKRAREILKDRFGQQHEVAKVLLEKVFACSRRVDNSAESLSDLAIEMQNCEIALTQMNYLHDLNSAVNIERIVRHFPQALRIQWAELADREWEHGGEPNFGCLRSFICRRARLASSRYGTLAFVDSSKSGRYSDRHQETHRQRQTGHTFMVRQHEQQDSNLLCRFCNAPHELSNCPQFKALPVANRWKFLKEVGGCFSCFALSHPIHKCIHQRKCNIDDCKAYHHPLLHNMNVIKSTPESVVTNNLSSKTTRASVQLGVIAVRITGPMGTVDTYALLDSGSDSTLISDELVSRLGIIGTQTDLNINTVTGSSSLLGRRCNFMISSPGGAEAISVENAISLPSLPLKFRAGSVTNELEYWPHLNDVTINEVEDKEIKLLIGCDVPEAHWALEQRLGKPKQPFAVRTLLGWMVLGPKFNGQRKHSSINYVDARNIDVLEHIQALYEHEFADTDSLTKACSLEDQRALDIVQNGIKWEDGCYTIPLPWKNLELRPNGNNDLAVKRLSYLKRRLLRDNSLRDKYFASMDHIFQKGYAMRVPDDQLCKNFTPRWYLPHHPVINPRKPGKIRVVFDCAAKSSGISLNDLLLSGPDTTTDLISVLMRFRSWPIAVAADIEEMFLQVRVPENDCGALRFLWWPANNIGENPVEYQMTVHPFGATSSPFCANFALRSTVSDFGMECNELVKEAVMSKFYVDDYLDSFPDATTAEQVSHQVCSLLKQGGFKLRRWLTNDNELSKTFPVDTLANQPRLLGAKDTPAARTLGIEWNALTDTFGFKVDFVCDVLTRRKILSVISSLYDPLGMVSPVLLPGKQLLQRLCKNGIGWDEPISLGDQDHWNRWLLNMRSIGDIEFPRCIRRHGTIDEAGTQLHIFCDASESGYGAVAYVRFNLRKSQPYCSLVFAKSRVTPLKQVTIPRLELMAAVLATQVFYIVTKALGTNFEAIYFWTDSMIVLYYINDVSTRFSTFIANRLAKIHSCSTPQQWRHVQSMENPADLASRGIVSQSELKRWVNGPDFLSLPGSDWLSPELGHRNCYPIELKRITGTVNTISTQHTVAALLTRFSEWFQLVKACAWLIRFKLFLSVKVGRMSAEGLRTGPLKLREMNEARLSVLRIVQYESYSDELKVLGSGVGIRMSSKSSIRKLNPVMINGLICVGGRLQYSNAPHKFKHPVILPKGHIITELLVRHYHLIDGHCGRTQLLSTIRRAYWIVQGGSTVKRVIGRCIHCRKQMAIMGKQMMAPLPSVRTDEGWYPFQVTGIDYFGPFLVKRGRAVEKRYGCLFTCLKLRAVHLEIAPSLSTDSFLLCLTRFVGRKGVPETIYSDNGTNFVGAVRELRSCQRDWDQSRINNKLLVQDIQWNFHPPGSSHRGGVWERIIRSVRRILNALSNEQTLTDETLQSFFVEAERIVNNRPLIPNTDGDEVEPLTPNHILLLRNLPGVFKVDNSLSHLNRAWRQVNYLALVFWRRWTAEYIPLLQTRQKWHMKHRNFQPGDLVMISTESMPKDQWPVGVVDEAVVDEDGLVRTVKVRTKSGILKRDIRRLCLLEGVD